MAACCAIAACNAEVVGSTAPPAAGAGAGAGPKPAIKSIAYGLFGGGRGLLSAEGRVAWCSSRMPTVAASKEQQGERLGSVEAAVPLTAWAHLLLVLRAS